MDTNEIDTIIEWTKDRISNCKVMIVCSTNKDNKDQWVNRLYAYEHTLEFLKSVYHG